MKGAIQVSWARQSKYHREMFKQVKEKQKQPLVGCLQLLSSLVVHKLLSSLFFKIV